MTEDTGHGAPWAQQDIDDEIKRTNHRPHGIIDQRVGKLPNGWWIIPCMIAGGMVWWVILT